MIKHFHPHERTPELCKLAVHNNLYAFVYLTPEERTMGLCIAAYQYNRDILKYMNDDQLTLEFYNSIVILDKYADTFIDMKHYRELKIKELLDN